MTRAAERRYAQEGQFSALTEFGMAYALSRKLLIRRQMAWREYERCMNGAGGVPALRGAAVSLRRWLTADEAYVLSRRLMELMRPLVEDTTDPSDIEAITRLELEENTLIGDRGRERRVRYYHD